MSSANDMSYSEKYADNKFEYRHVTIPKDLVKRLPKRLMTEDEWRRFGVQQSRGESFPPFLAKERLLLPAFSSKVEFSLPAFSSKVKVSLSRLF